MQLEEKLKVLANLKARKAAQENDLKSTEALIEEAQGEIVDEFESRQIKSMKLDGVGNFVMKVSSFPKIYDPALLRNWMDSHGVAWDTITALNAKKLQGFYNERLDAGEELPAGVETFTKSSIALTKGA